MITRYDIHVYRPAAPDDECEVSVPLPCGHRIEQVIGKFVNEKEIKHLIDFANAGGKCRQCQINADYENSKLSHRELAENHIPGK